MKGFFLVFELVIGLLLLMSVWQSSFPHAIFPPSSSLARTCWDVVNIWSAGEDDLSTVAHGLAPNGKISTAFVPFSSISPSAHTFICQGERFRNGKWEELFVRVEE